MKLIRFALLLTAASTMFAAGPANCRTRNQYDRIADGYRNGSLTSREAARLRTQERQLQQSIRRDRIDGGGLTWRERERIDERQDRLSRQIHRQRHDGQRR